MTSQLSDFLVCGVVTGTREETIIKLRKEDKIIKHDVYCKNPLIIMDYTEGISRSKLPILYFCSLCKQYYRKDDTRIKGKCRTCNQIVDDPFKHKFGNRCFKCYWTKKEV